MRRLALGLVLIGLVGQGRAPVALAGEQNTLPAAPVIQPGPGQPLSGEQVSVQDSPVTREGDLAPGGMGRNQPARGWLRNHPWNCWSTQNSMGCGSLRAEYLFIFSRCRTFYGEPCYKGRPPFPGTGDEAGTGGCGCP